LIGVTTTPLGNFSTSSMDVEVSTLTPPAVICAPTDPSPGCSPAVTMKVRCTSPLAESPRHRRMALEGTGRQSIAVRSRVPGPVPVQAVDSSSGLIAAWPYVQVCATGSTKTCAIVVGSLLS
jgi:hypothetical protein